MGIKVRSEDVRRIVKLADKDRDGRIDYNEFVEFIESHGIESSRFESEMGSVRHEGETEFITAEMEPALQEVSFEEDV